MDKICLNCNIFKKHFAKGLCRKCYVIQWTFYKKGETWNKTCTICKEKYFSKSSVSRAKYCQSCAYKVNIDNHRKRNRLKKGIPIDKPVKFKKKSGEGYICPYGYKFITIKGHPNSKGKQGRIGEHTFIMSEYLKRPLKKSESVHHKNGIKHDNRIENLELWHKGQPSGQRLEDKIQWAKEFLQKYGYKILDTISN